MHYQAARLCFTEESSYRAVGRQLEITPLTAFRWIDELGGNCKSFEEVAEELKPRWGGYLLADGKAIFVKGKEHALLLTADVHSQNIPMAQLSRSKNREGWESVFTMRFQKGIKKDNPFALSDSGEIGVGMSTPFSSIHPENSFGPEPHFFHQSTDTMFQLFILNRLKFVEKRRDHPWK
jgi:hypothetical protein